jgi:hypothetical protein
VHAPDHRLRRDENAARRAPAPSSPAAGLLGGLTALQRTAGNAAVVRMLGQAGYPHAQLQAQRSAIDDGLSTTSVQRVEATAQQSGTEQILAGFRTYLDGNKGVLDNPYNGKFASVYTVYMDEKGLGTGDEAWEAAEEIWNEALKKRQESAAALAADLEARRARTVPARRDTWKMAQEPLRYKDSAYGAYVKDADQMQLAANQIRPNDKGGQECELNKAYHIHGAKGGQGVTFAYLLDEDYRVYAYVYDVADKRYGNKYKWVRGKNTGYTSIVPIEGLSQSVQRAAQLGTPGTG